MFTGENITKIIAEAEGQERAVLILFASSGIRAGELFGLEVKHFSGNSLTIEQSVWEGRIQTPEDEECLSPGGFCTPP
jgi:integrase